MERRVLARVRVRLLDRGPAEFASTRRVSRGGQGLWSEHMSGMTRFLAGVGMVLDPEERQRKVDAIREAAKEYGSAREMQVKLVANHPAVPQYRSDLANTHSNLGNLLAALGKRKEAAKEYENAREIQIKLVADHLASVSSRLISA